MVSYCQHSRSRRCRMEIQPTLYFGGKWVAGIKSVKHHLRRIIGDTVLTYEEISTLLIQIEAVLNSRSLCPLSIEFNDIDTWAFRNWLSFNHHAGNHHMKIFLLTDYPAGNFFANSPQHSGNAGLQSICINYKRQSESKKNHSWR